MFVVLVSFPRPRPVAQILVKMLDNRHNDKIKKDLPLSRKAKSRPEADPQPFSLGKQLDAKIVHPSPARLEVIRKEGRAKQKDIP